MELGAALKECPTLCHVERAVAGCRVDGVGVQVGCLVAHPECYARSEIRRRLSLSGYRLDRAIDDLRWVLDLPPKGALGRDLLLLALGHATRGRTLSGPATVRAGATLAVRYVHSLALPGRERGVLACVVNPHVGTYEATEHAVGRSRTVVRRATRRLRLFFDAPKQGQLVLKVLHAALRGAEASRSPEV